MKKGISLIVLVITIIVMIIIAGAIIISLNSSNVIQKADQAKKDSNVAELKSAVALAYANAYTAALENGPVTSTGEAAILASVQADATVASLLSELGGEYVVQAGTNGGVVVATH